MSKQISSVDWLIDRILQDQLHRDISHKVWIELFEQAKAMHEAEIIDAWIAVDNELQRISAEQYYNETYKGGEQ